MASDQDAAIFAECDQILRESADLLDRAQRSPSPPPVRRKSIGRLQARSAPADGLIHKRSENARVPTAVSAPPVLDEDFDEDTTVILDAVGKALALQHFEGQDALQATADRLRRNFEDRIAPLEQRVRELEAERSKGAVIDLPALPLRRHVG